MPQQFARQELYDLAWSQPMRDIAATLGLSDVGLAKIYKKADIPFPPRGYWAKKRAGGQVIQIALPPRLPGAPDRLWVGGEPRDWGWGKDWEQTTLAAPIPPEPAFDESMDALTERVRKMVGHVPFLRTFQAAFGDVSKLLAQDEKRRKSQWSFDKPIYDSGPARRRLLILHSLFFALRRLGYTASMRTAQYLDERDRGIYVRVGNVHVCFTLEPITGPSRGHRIEKDADHFRLAFTTPGATKPPTRYWDDADNNPLEKQLTEIVVQILVRGEEVYRDGLVRTRQWLIERKEEVRKAIQKREEERIQKARERLEKEQKQLLDGLLGQAADLQKAFAIRSYVQSMRAQLATLPVTMEDFETWSAWALSEADRIDPSRSAKFLDLIPKSTEAQADSSVSEPDMTMSSRDN